MDHNHVTEEFRGWICQTCNIGLGHFKDSVQGLEKAIDYLKRTEKRKGTLSAIEGMME